MVLEDIAAMRAEIDEIRARLRALSVEILEDPGADVVVELDDALARLRELKLRRDELQRASRATS